jgi:hypothetical protein
LQAKGNWKKYLKTKTGCENEIGKRKTRTEKEGMAFFFSTQLIVASSANNV